ncbi:myosin-binding striated muscle assembly central-domain-containing protein [Corynascus similis CBS 632.67]
MSSPGFGSSAVAEPMSRQDKTLLLFARLMEGGKEDQETAADLAELTKLLSEDHKLTKKGEKPITSVIDIDCVDTIFGLLDMRQADAVRAQATLCTTAYLNAAGEEGHQKVTEFFHARMQRATYDDYIVAFCAATALFPIAYDLMADLIHTEGFLPSLAPLMRRKFKSKKVETACLEMLQAACLQMKCHAAIYKYCIDWMEEVIFEDPEDRVETMWEIETDLEIEEEGAGPLRRHCEKARNLAAVVWMKIMAAPVQLAENQGTEPKIESATSKMEILSKRFAKMLSADSEEFIQCAVEGLAFATTRPIIREQVGRDKDTLQRLVKILESAPAKSALEYGTLSIFAHLTRYQPNETEEQKRLRQLKAYANAAGKVQPDPLTDDAHVAERCRLVFEAGVASALSRRGNTASAASLVQIVSILFSLSVTQSRRGQLAQQGAVRVLVNAWNTLPRKDEAPRRIAAQALARVLISVNPQLVFAHIPEQAAISPLVSLLVPDPTAETRDLLPTFEALMALTNLASGSTSGGGDEHAARRAIVRAAWDAIEELLFCSNARVCTAAVELICNLVQDPEQAIGLFGDGSAKASTRIKIILAMADAEDEPTRSAAGGALASISMFDGIARGILTQPRGAEIILGLCRDDSEGLRHRGAVVVDNLISHEGDIGKLAKEKLFAAGGVLALSECAKKSRTPEVIQAAVHVLRALLEGQNTS